MGLGLVLDGSEESTRKQRLVLDWMLPRSRVSSPIQYVSKLCSGGRRNEGSGDSTDEKAAIPWKGSLVISAAQVRPHIEALFAWPCPCSVGNSVYVLLET